MKRFLALALVCLRLSVYSQPTYEFKEVLSENVYVASTAAYWNPLASNKRDRVLRDAPLPQGTVAYTFRATVTETTTAPQSSLITDVAKIGGVNLISAGVIANLVTASDGNQADLYIFDNWTDAHKFENKQEGWWGCKAYKQTTSTCRTNNECLGMVAFGFRNNNNVAGLNIFFELVAVIDVSKKYYSQSVRDGLYTNCINQEEIKTATRDKAPDFCSCFADKLANNPSFTTSEEQTVREKISKEVAQTCLQELNIASKSEISSAAFYEEVKQIEASRGKASVISYCEDKIVSGVTDDFVYNCLGWNCLLTKQLTKAVYYLKTAQEKYPLNLYLKENYAHSLLLTGKYSEALEIYKAHLNENITENISWKSAVLDDITKFKTLGIADEHFDEILNLVR